MPSADFCTAVNAPLDDPSRRSDTEPISGGKFSRLLSTTAESTLRTLDGSGLRGKLPARPALTPCIRFLFIGSHIFYTLLLEPNPRPEPLPSLQALTSHQVGQGHFPPNLLARPRPDLITR